MSVTEYFDNQKQKKHSAFQCFSGGMLLKKCSVPLWSTKSIKNSGVLARLGLLLIVIFLASALRSAVQQKRAGRSVLLMAGQMSLRFTHRIISSANGDHDAFQ